VRRAADVVRAGLVCASVSLLLAGDGAVAAKVVLVLPATVAARVLAVPPLLDLLFALALATEAAGSALAGHGLIWWDDRVSHLVLPLLCGLVVCAALQRTGVAGRPGRAGLVTGAAVLAIALVWEAVEWGVDATVGTNFSMGREDTVGDLSADALAAAGAAVAAVMWHAGGARALGRPGGAA
jgi:hypothetical protein